MTPLVDTRDKYRVRLIQGLPWPEGVDPALPYLVWIQVDGRPMPTPAELRAEFVRRCGYEPAGVHGLGVIAVGPIEEEKC